MSRNDRLAYLQWQRNSKRSELESSKQLIQSIDEKLARLKQAKKAVNTIYQDMKQLRKDTYAIRDKEEWQGSKKEEFMQEMEMFKSHFEQYVQDINQYYDEICNTITRLENEKMSQESIAGGLLGMLNSLGNEIHKLLHS